MDRPSLSPFELLDQIEREFGMKMAPVLWPIGDGEQFKVRTMTPRCRCYEVGLPTSVYQLRCGAKSAKTIMYISV